MSEVWNKRSGSKLAVLQEGSQASINLPLEKSVPVELISGKLPPGMTLSDTAILGVPEEVTRNTVFRFVLRATESKKVYDRTFNIEIQGEDAPVWVTPEDLLPVGQNDSFFILDSSFIDFQLEAVDSDTAAGQKLRYFIPNGGGELPPGITLTEDGRLVGIVEPILALEKEADRGFYDTGRFDRYPFDFAIKSTSGYDSFAYDETRFDFKTPTRVPKKLNRFYQFTVSVSDGDAVTSRTFRIFVVGDDFLRADNTITQVATGVFTADNTYIRTPIWTANSNLGIFRANNFITIFLDTLDPNDIPGTITYELLPTNDDGSESVLPPGTLFDRNTGEIFGRVPYQSAVTNEYKFTVNARRFESGISTVELQQFAVEGEDQNSVTVRINKLGELSSRVVNRTFTFENTIYSVQDISTRNEDFDLITIDKPLQDRIPQGAEINLGRVNVASSEVAESERTFRVSLIGEIDSTIRWLTDSNLGSIPSNYISILRVRAETTVKDSFLLYTIEEGSLPPGLELAFNGEIIGRVDNESVSEDSEYQFTVKARDQFGFSAIEQTFVLEVENLDDTLYSNVYYRPLLPRQQRVEFDRFVANPEIFIPQSVYRPQDPNFGVQRNLDILVYAGIETEDAEKYVAAAATTASRKTLKINTVKKAIAQQPGTRDPIYEVIYLDVYDPYEKSGDVAKKIKISTSEKITVDSVRTTPKDPLYDTTNLSFVDIETRNGSIEKTYFQDSFSVDTRDEVEELPLLNEFLIDTRENGEQLVDYKIGSSTNIFYRPTYENTIRADSTAIKVSEVRSTTRYINNISNLRDNLREVGKTDIQFLPLWMRTPQEGTLQELGYTLAVPLAYVKPGEADRILSAIRASNIDFRQFELDVDRFVIDSTKDRADEQYILFANYQFNLV